MQENQSLQSLNLTLNPRVKAQKAKNCKMEPVLALINHFYISGFDGKVAFKNSIFLLRQNAKTFPTTLKPDAKSWRKTLKPDAKSSLTTLKPVPKTLKKAQKKTREFRLELTRETYITWRTFLCFLLACHFWGIPDVPRRSRFTFCYFWPVLPPPTLSMEYIYIYISMKPGGPSAFQNTVPPQSYDGCIWSYLSSPSFHARYHLSHSKVAFWSLRFTKPPCKVPPKSLKGCTLNHLSSPKLYTRCHLSHSKVVTGIT